MTPAQLKKKVKDINEKLDVIFYEDTGNPSDITILDDTCVERYVYTFVSQHYAPMGVNFLCGVINKVEVSDGTKITGEDLRHLSAYAATELLGKLRFNQEDAKEFIDGVESGENDLFDKYWKRFSDRVKSVRKHD